MIKVKKDFKNIPYILTTPNAEQIRKILLREGRRHTFSDYFYTHESVKDELCQIYNNKCAYCESKIKTEVDHFTEVNHFRPIYTANGYYWLGYEWSNLLLCCNQCSKYKSDKFPIKGIQVKEPQKHREQWLANSKSFMAEKALLLNPEIDEPENHILFLRNGMVASKTRPGKKTIEICGLNREGLISSRKKLIDRFSSDIRSQLQLIYQKMEQEELQTKEEFQGILEKEFGNLFKELLQAQKPENEFSRLGWYMFNNFEEFFIEDLPSNQQRKILKQAFLLFNKGFINENRLNEKIKQQVSVDSGSVLEVKLDELTIKNFKGFKEKNIKFSAVSNFNLLIGDNAAGKTTILDAISRIISCGFKDLGIGDTYKIKDEEIHYIPIHNEDITKEPQEKVLIEVNATVIDKNIKWEAAKYSREKITIGEVYQLSEIIAQFRKFAAKGEPVILPVFAYYGTGRLFLQKKERNDNHTPISSRFDSYFDCLNPRADKKDLQSWFRRQELIKSQKKETSLYKTVKTVLKNCIENCEDIKFDVQEDSIMIKLSDADYLPAHLLSDGYKTMLVMTGDIAYKMCKLNPHLKNAADKTPGIVLIDEIDLHLHPLWQRRVVEDLKQSFPKVQFIAATHSPFIIQSLRPGELINLNTDKLSDYADSSIEDITEDVMGVEMPQKSKRYIRMFEASEAYYRLLQEGKDIENKEKIREIKNKLDELLIPFSDDPAFMSFLKMERTAALGGDNHETSE
jgi:uncharacterized protein (TIGR02646 family)